MSAERLLVVGDSDGVRIDAGTRKAVRFAQEWARLTGGEFDLLLLGSPGFARSVTEWSGFGADRIHLLESERLVHPTAAIAALAVAGVARASSCASVAAASTSFGRDVLPRVAALLDAPMLSDVLSIRMEGGLVFTRPVYAGAFIATVSVEGGCVFGVRESAFAEPEAVGGASAIGRSDLSDLPDTIDAEWLSLDGAASERPDLGTARVVVSGGRPLRDSATFERLIGGLADRLGGATGSTRAAVDSGIAPNEMQVGQTGRTVAPQLYIAAGISGSVQHLAGMKDSKTIVAINTDPEAPIFEVADLGLVADLHAAVPELIEALRP